MTTKHAQMLAAKWGARFPDDELTVLAQAGYGNPIGLGKRPALLVVDVTYSFCGSAPMPILDAIAVNRRSCGQRAWDAIGPMQRLLAAARNAGLPIVFSAMRDPKDPAFEPGLWGAKNARGVEDSAGETVTFNRDNEVLDELRPLRGELLLAKDKPSIFQGTGLIPYLVGHGVDSLIICGGTTSGCVYASAVDGFSNNYRVSVAQDACFDRVDTPHWSSLLDIDMKYADVVESADLIDLLSVSAANMRNTDRGPGNE